MIDVVLVVMATWLGTAVLLAVLAGRVLGGARRLAERYERCGDLRRGPIYVEHLANRATPSTAFGTAVARLVL